MKKCTSCESLILIWGIRKEKLYFCNIECFEKWKTYIYQDEINADDIEKYAAIFYGWMCNYCNKREHLDLHNFYKIFSFYFGYKLYSDSIISCKICWVKKQLIWILYSLFFWWWSIEWFIRTPIYIFMNICGILSFQDSNMPSRKIKNVAKLFLADKLYYDKKYSNKTII